MQFNGDQQTRILPVIYVADFAKARKAVSLQSVRRNFGYPIRELWLTLCCQELYCEPCTENASFLLIVSKGLLNPIRTLQEGLVKNFGYSYARSSVVVHDRLPRVCIVAQSLLTQSSTIKLSRCHEDQTRLTNCPSSKCPALGFILLKSGMFKIERSSRSGNSRIKYDIES
ncbi:hypothetical protein F8M41_001364 [Gigaspora margarita]|uniref:Uncharacterized protein n=1 Tax=Gigaspora margarita TaxID=4874 RepID=A0A8H3XH16_GIGMA|nr:hypothetical protein F8M41_001364 [Gigaspora margarita]